MEETVSSTEDQLLRALFPLAEGMDKDEHAAWEKGIRSTFEQITRAAADAAKELQDEDGRVAKKQLKAAEAVHAMKLETARKAARVNLTHQASSIQASVTAQMEQRQKDMDVDSGALEAAHAKIEAMQLRNDGLAVSTKHAEEALDAAQRKIHSQGDLYEKLQRESKELQEEASRARAEMRSNLSQLDIVRDEKMTLAEQVRAVSNPPQHSCCERRPRGSSAHPYTRVVSTGGCIGARL